MTRDATLQDLRENPRTQVLVIDPTAERTTGDGGHWWEVAIPEVSQRREVDAAHAAYVQAKIHQRL